MSFFFATLFLASEALFRGEKRTKIYRGYTYSLEEIEEEEEGAVGGGAAGWL